LEQPTKDTTQRVSPVLHQAQLAISDPNATPPDFRYQFVAAAKAIRPALVSITSTSSISPEARSPFEFFFRGPTQPEGRALRRGIGSGVIVDVDGHVLTNNHVVADADTLKITLADNHEMTAKVVGSDPKTDIAVVKIDPSDGDLPIAALGDSERLEVGEWVMAAGSPFGLRQTVSAGIVSAVGRGNMGITDYEDFIQTDAAVNPGNSGGPLVDLEGRVVGINTAIASPSGGNNGVGFAVPISMARTVMFQLLKTGKVVRGYLGVAIGDLSPELARSFDYQRQGGVLVQDVSADGPGARAGLKPGDIIVELDGKPLPDAATFRNAIADTPPGTSTTLVVWRDGKRQTLQAKLGELPSSEKEARGGSRDEHARWGIRMSNITPELQQRLELNTAKGAVIVAVEPNSAAGEAGLLPGDVIMAVGHSPVDDAAAAQSLLKKAAASDKPVRLRVLRDGQGMFVALPNAR
jgi:serine protease Do